MKETLHEAYRKAGRCLAAAFCAMLALALLCMAAAVLVQAMAVLITALLAVRLFFRHPLRWYAERSAEAVNMFAEAWLSCRKKEEKMEPPSGE